MSNNTKLKIAVVFSLLLFICSLPASADVLDSIESQITTSVDIETNPRLGEDAVSEIVVYTSRQ